MEYPNLLQITPTFAIDGTDIANIDKQMMSDDPKCDAKYVRQIFSKVWTNADLGNRAMSKRSKSGLKQLTPQKVEFAKSM